MKRLLLYFTLVAFGINATFSQVPTNGDITNATLIPGFPYSDNNIKLDLASIDLGGQQNCSLGSFETVYYKFTANVNEELNVNLLDANSQTINNSIVIVYTAPDINTTDNNQLSSISACDYGSNVSINTVQGTHYFILIHRSDPGAFTNIDFYEGTTLPVPEIERDALIALYNSTNGINWDINTNWNTANDVSTWYGITTAIINGTDHITRIGLGGNNLTGTLPTEIGDFTELTHFWAWSNQLTGSIPSEIGNLTNLIEMDLSPNTFSGSIPPEIGNLINLEVLWLNQNGLTGTIPSSFQNLTSLRQLYLIGSASPAYSSSVFFGDFPDLTALPLEILRMERNYFTFNDIADEFATYQANIAEFIFSPQYTVDVPEDIVSNVGDDIELTLTDVPGTNKTGSANRLVPNTYQWYKDFVAITGADENSYTIVNAQPSDSGSYHCVITNPDIPGMEIHRVPITVNVGTVSIEDNLLSYFSIYPNPTTGFINIKQQNITKIKVSLFDIRGRLIKANDFESKVSQLDLSNIQNGLYVLYIQSEGKQIVKNIIKQ